MTRSTERHTNRLPVGTGKGPHGMVYVKNMRNNGKLAFKCGFVTDAKTRMYYFSPHAINNKLFHILTTYRIFGVVRKSMYGFHNPYEQ